MEDIMEKKKVKRGMRISPRVGDPPVPNRAHTELKKEQNKKEENKNKENKTEG